MSNNCAIINCPVFNLIKISLIVRGTNNKKGEIMSIKLQKLVGNVSPFS